ncbi:diaminopimelate dehydrogenase [Clostridium septicum]|uniref:diaminopimelate dehydrogenase n=1 Tax=Clostridium septicum TaxID=1504 RepID=UPI00272E2329|nr:diaminopimelate dehydrogenase [Clostridium septicum]WLF68385.1 diaminopimelate dehydrogenase [Clostridium septicum]
MSNKIRIGVVGYGNLGKGVEMAVAQNDDFELVKIFTRRDVQKVKTFGAEVDSINNIQEYKGLIDVMILCGGSATDLRIQGPMVAEMFNTVDSFDNHPKIPEHFEKMDEVAKASKNLSVISVGWDPGLFSLNRLIGQVALPEGTDYTFWGTGVSQGHSDAIRRIEGVKNGIQYTIPVESALEKVRLGQHPELTAREKHTRVCYVVAEEGADLDKIENEIKNMPSYFADYDTTVNFISEDELEKNHKGMPHGGFVIRTGTTGDGTKQRVEFSLDLGSNPEFTSSILIAYARAAYRLSKEGKTGALTVLDIPFGYLSAKNREELRKDLL